MDEEAVDSPSPGGDAPHRLPAIDLLRGFAILWVVVYHLWGDVKIAPQSPRVYDARLVAQLTEGRLNGLLTAFIDAVARVGYQGVPLFMMLSGVSLYLASSRHSGQSALAFYRQRARRLLLPYWVALPIFMLGVVIVALLIQYWNGGSFSQQYHHGVTLTSFNVIDMTWQKALLYLALFPRAFSDTWLNTPPGGLWFVILLVQYYLLFPWLRQALDRFGVARFLAASLVIQLAFDAWIVRQYGGLAQPTALHISTSWAPARMLEFTLGVALGYALMHHRAALAELVTSPLDILSVVAIGLLLQIAGGVMDDRLAYAQILGPATVIIGLTTLSLPLMLKAPGLLESLPPLRLLAWVGVISYGVLIINEPMRLFQSALRGQLSESWWWFFVVVLYVPLSVALAYPLSAVLGLLPKRAPAAAPDASDAAALVVDPAPLA
ncbi:MAG: acyltransferase [Chloroflexi bacterium]|nr:acyltransferase [Chloroflexota bacterium]